MDEKPDVSRRERKANNQKMVNATDFTIDYVINQMTVLARIYVNCTNGLMKENFNFSIGIHGESSQARLRTQAAALVYRGVVTNTSVVGSTRVLT